MFNANTAKIMNEIIVKSNIEDIKAAKPYTVTLYKQFAFSGVINPMASFKFALIGDLAKWCSLKQNNCMN